MIALTKRSPILLQFLSFTDRISKSFLKFNKVFLPNYGVLFLMQNESTLFQWAHILTMVHIVFCVLYYTRLLELIHMISTSTSLRPPSIIDDTATLVRMPILRLIFKT